MQSSEYDPQPSQDDLNKYPAILKSRYERIKGLGKGKHESVILYGLKTDSDQEDSQSQDDQNVFAVKFEEIIVTRVQQLLKESLLIKKMSRELNMRIIPEYISHGLAKEDTRSYNYLIMERLDTNLFLYIKEKMTKIPKSQHQWFLQIVMVRLLEALQKFHTTGFVHLDIKPRNIMIREANDKIGQNQDEFCFINLGTAQEYNDSDGDHRVFRQTEVIKGAIFFASYNNLMMNDLSRRDDLESLFLTMIYIINRLVLNQAVGFPYEKSVEIPENINLLQAAQKLEIAMNLSSKVDQYLFKQNHTNPLIKQIIRCFQIVRKLSFEDKPDYLKLVEIIQEGNNNLDKILQTSKSMNQYLKEAQSNEDNYQNEEKRREEERKREEQKKRDEERKREEERIREEERKRAEERRRQAQREEERRLEAIREEDRRKEREEERRIAHENRSFFKKLIKWDWS
eukprot:403365313